MKKRQKKVVQKPPRFEKFLFGMLFTLVIFTAFEFGMLSLGDANFAKDDLKKAGFFYNLAGFSLPGGVLKQRQLALSMSKDLRSIYTPSEAVNSEEIQQEKIVGRSLTVPVLMYHYIRVNPSPSDIVGYNLSVTPENFGLQMEYLSTHNYHVITPDDLVPALLQNAPLPEKPIIITFDDGYADSHDNALPILQKFGFKGIEFIATGLVGAPNYLTWDKIMEMKNRGVFVFGAHSVHHFALTYLSPDAVGYELRTSKKELEERLGYNINSFAYPYGNTNTAIEQSARNAGFLIAFGTRLGYQQSAGQIYDLPRIRIGGTDTISSFADKLPWR